VYSVKKRREREREKGEVRFLMKACP